MAIKAIIFDCFGVLLKEDGILSIVNSQPERSSDYNKLLHKNDIGKMSQQQFIKSFSEISNVNKKELLDKYLDMDEKSVYNDDVINWAKQIKKEGKYKVGMLSNVGFGWLDNFLSDNEEKDLFDAYILSCNEGISKPDPRIFRMIAEKLGCKPEDCIMIDDRETNIEGARLVGMSGIVFSSLQQGQTELNKLLGK